MKSFYKSIFAFILFAVPFNDLFAQQLAVVPSFSYDFVDKGYYDKGSCFSTGVNLFADVKKHFTFQTGLIFSRKSFYYKPPLPELPLQPVPNGVIFPPKGTFYWAYDMNYVFKSLQIPFNVSYNFYRNHFIDIYALAGTSFKFRLNQFLYGEQYLIIDDTVTDYSLSHYDAKIWDNDENIFKFQGMCIEFAIGANVILSEHIAAGIEFQLNDALYEGDWYRSNYPSLALFAKYYFDGIKRPKN